MYALETVNCFFFFCLFFSIFLDIIDLSNILNSLAWDGTGISGANAITLFFRVTDYICDKSLFLKLEV